MTDAGGQQAQAWRSEFGREYTERNELSLDAMETLYRNRYGLSRTELNHQFLEGFGASTRMLEVGSNIGNQLLCLQKMGFHRLVGVDLQDNALLRLRSRAPGIVAILAAGQALPLSSAAFDLVLTSGLLIHIPPNRVTQVMTEIHRCARSYIWGLEYYSDSYEEVTYRGKHEMLWKTDFAGLYLESFPDLEIVRRKRLRYREQTLEDEMFLLRKKKPGE